MNIYIENSTEDDATVKVSPGGIGKDDEGGNKPRVEGQGPAATKTIVKARTREKVSLPSCPSCVVHFMVPVEVGSHSVTSGTIKGLKLTEGNKGYKIEVIKNGRKPRA